MILDRNWRNTWTHPLGELRDAPIGDHLGEMKELEGRVRTINTVPARLTVCGGLPECLGGLLVASGPIYILLMQSAMETTSHSAVGEQRRQMPPERNGRGGDENQ
jgi:hypothetical protein